MDGTELGDITRLAYWIVFGIFETFEVVADSILWRQVFGKF